MNEDDVFILGTTSYNWSKFLPEVKEAWRLFDGVSTVKDREDMVLSVLTPDSSATVSEINAMTAKIMERVGK